MPIKKPTAPAEQMSIDVDTDAAKTADYGDSSIQSLKGEDRIRLRPAAILGSDGLEGCEHAFFEILSNSVDEAREGHGTRINVTACLDHSMTVEDFGRGVPLGFNKRENRWNWDLIYCEMYAGGKYQNNGGGAYQFSLGLNGLGACAAQYTSEYFEVSSFDGETESHMNFEKGRPKGKLSTRTLKPSERRTGTVQHWKPDLDVFTSVDIPEEFFKDVLHRQAMVNPGIEFHLRLERKSGQFEETDFFYANGIADYITERTGDAALTPPVLWHLETEGRDRADLPEYKMKADFTFCVSSSVTFLEYYHNSSYLEHGGSPDRAVRIAFVNALDKYLKTTGKYNKNESKITIADIQDCLALVISSFSTMTSYENQTKKAINNAFIYEAMTAFLKEQLEFYFMENPNAAEIFARQVLVNKRSREQAESTRINLKKKLTANIDIGNRVEKFVNCRTKDAERRELYIVEGDSALTSCKLARDAEFQAIIPVRGKTLNCMKADYAQIFKSDIITDLLRVIGCGVEIHDKKVKTDLAGFDLSALRWSKIIICTDADEDGFQIRTLLLTLFYRLLPTLIREERIYIAETPLFEITTKNDTYFAYNEFEKADILRRLEGKKYTLQRSKGLGENEPDMMNKTTMNPRTRRLILVSPSDAAATEAIFETLLGNDLPGRKDFIAKNGHLYMKDADI